MHEYVCELKWHPVKDDDDDDDSDDDDMMMMTMDNMWVGGHISYYTFHFSMAVPRWHSILMFDPTNRQYICHPYVAPSGGQTFMKSYVAMQLHATLQFVVIHLVLVHFVMDPWCSVKFQELCNKILNTFPHLFRQNYFLFPNPNWTSSKNKIQIVADHMCTSCDKIHVKLLYNNFNIRFSKKWEFIFNKQIVL